MRRILITCAVLFVVSQILFLINIQFPRGPNFDEFHYIPSAKQFLEFKVNQNWEHPPLAKELMAIGIAIWGDRPIGWRFMSTIFGSFTLIGMYLWALALFREYKIAVWVALITLVNQMLYVQARIGMLDTFMFAFIAWGMAAFTATWEPARLPGSTGGPDSSHTQFGKPKRRPKIVESSEPETPQALSSRAMTSQAQAIAEPVVVDEPEEVDLLWRPLTTRQTKTLLLVSGICFGLGTSCKWFTVIPWFLCIGLVCLIRVLQSWKTHFDSPGEDDWYSPRLWKGIRLWDWVLALGVVPLAFYYIPFFWYLLIKSPDYTLLKIFTTMQTKMFHGQERVVAHHPYMSTWSQWATLKRPIWYAFDHEGPKNELVRGVILLGNPWILWTGLLGLVGCLWGWIKERRRDAFLILMAYGAFYFCWVIIPRKIFFFYYYYPAAMTLSFALGYVFFHGEKALGWKKPWARWAFFAVALGLFIYFFPISAALQIKGESFRKWMWRTSWI